MTLPNRPLTLPSSDNPRLMVRALELVAQGVRSTRGLQETLALDARSVQHLLQSSQWLGFIENDTEVALTSTGLEYVYGGRERSRIFARAVLATPLCQKALRGRATVPELSELEALVARHEVDRSETELRPRAKAIQCFLTPAYRYRGAFAAESQLELPLFAREGEVPFPKLGFTTGRDYNPDVYRYVLTTLIDHGELGPGHLRALLDRAGVSEAPIGSYIDLAIARGEAVRLDERLVTTPQAVERRTLAETTSSIILSDPGYRAYLKDLRAAAAGDRPAEIRVERFRGRYRAWDRRLFGKDVSLDQLEAQLSGVVLDRSLEAFPEVKGPGQPPPAIKGSFLDHWQTPSLPVCLPPTLAMLRTGLPAVNEALRVARQVAHEVNPPDLSLRPLFYHGGLLAPGEPLPRSIPDLRTLRSRLVSNAPYVAVTLALLLLHRATPDHIDIVQRRGGLVVRSNRQPIGDLFEWIDGFGQDKDWLISRRRQGGLPPVLFLRALEAVGAVTTVGAHVVLAERFFVQLRADSDERELFQRLQALVESVAAWIEQQRGEPEGEYVGSEGDAQPLLA